MGKFLALVVVLALILGGAYYLGWFGVSRTTSNESRESVELTMDKAKIKEDTSKVTEKAKDLAHGTKEGVKDAAGKVSNGFSSKDKQELRLLLDKKTVELEPGGKTDIKITRSSANLKATHLTMTPSSTSNLSASGGEFKAGETEAVVTIEARPGAKDGTVSLETEGESERVDVTVKNKI